MAAGEEDRRARGAGDRRDARRPRRLANVADPGSPNQGRGGTAPGRKGAHSEAGFADSRAGRRSPACRPWSSAGGTSPTGPAEPVAIRTAGPASASRNGRSSPPLPCASTASRRLGAQAFPGNVGIPTKRKTPGALPRALHAERRAWDSNPEGLAPGGFQVTEPAICVRSAAMSRVSLSCVE